jgi:peptide/nickel transport system substrate-binding protein
VTVKPTKAGPAVVLCSLIALTAAACSGSGAGGSAGSSGARVHNPAVKGLSFGAAANSVVRPSLRRSAVLTFVDSGVPDSTDPGNTSELNMWDFSRLYATPLMTYRSCPGACGRELEPGLATGPGTVSANGLVWTFHLKSGIRFSDGQPVTSQDVKYAVERTFARSVLGTGPDVFPTILAPQVPAYQGPYRGGSSALMGLKAVITPNSTTVEFRLARPFADFNYVAAMPQTAPVPPARDSGASYQQHPVSTGPYEFASYHAGQQFTLIDNPNWQPAEDPQVRQMASKIVVNLNVSAATLAAELAGPDAPVNLSGSVPAQMQEMILGDPTFSDEADYAPSSQLDFVLLNQAAAPLGNVYCRRAIEFAVSKSGLQAAEYGSGAAGQVAAAAVIPGIVGAKMPDYYQAVGKPGGDVAAAKAQLGKCGHRAGFAVSIGYSEDVPAQTAAAQSLVQSLEVVGIAARLDPIPAAAGVAGGLAYVRQHHLSMGFGSWTALSPTFSGWFTSGAIGQLADAAASGQLARLEAAGAAEPAVGNQIDQEIMSAAMLVPVADARTLLYRNPAVTNVYVQAFFGQYNYGVLGLEPVQQGQAQQGQAQQGQP